MTTWEPVRPFDIDNGELDGLSLQEAFVLGYELAQIDALFDSGESFAKPVHAKNADRIKAEADRRGRKYQLTWLTEDSSESWMWLNVEATDD